VAERPPEKAPAQPIQEPSESPKSVSWAELLDRLRELKREFYEIKEGSQ